MLAAALYLGSGLDVLRPRTALPPEQRLVCVDDGAALDADRARWGRRFTLALDETCSPPPRVRHRGTERRYGTHLTYLVHAPERAPWSTIARHGPFDTLIVSDAYHPPRAVLDALDPDANCHFVGLATRGGRNGATRFGLDVGRRTGTVVEALTDPRVQRRFARFTYVRADGTRVVSPRWCDFHRMVAQDFR